MGQLDRRKHDFDVMERVLGGLGLDGRPSQVVEFAVRSWLGGSMGSVVQVTILGDDTGHFTGSRSDEDR